jgi:uncharacterized protein (UPF0335 family)
MDDIVERLMNRHCCQDNLDQEAAQEIERLREENKQFINAIRKAFVELDAAGLKKAADELFEVLWQLRFRN